MSFRKILAFSFALVAGAFASERRTDLSLLGSANQLLSGATFTVKSGATFVVESGATFTIPASVLTQAAADGTTKGIATFTAADFNASSGVISIDYTNGQAASGSTKGFLTSGDWTTFSNKFGTSTPVDSLDAARFAADAGASDTYAATLSPAPSAYATGVHYRFKANTANTGAATINFNALGAKTIKKAAGGITTDLADNDIRAGQWVDLVYDGTNMQMQSTLGNASGGGGSGDVVGPASAVDLRIAVFDGTTGKLIKDGAKTIADINPIGTQSIWIPAAAMTPTVTNGCSTLATVEISSSVPNVASYDFNKDTAQYAQFSVAFPKAWNNGTITAQFYWSHASTTTNFGVVWGIQGVYVGDNSAVGGTFGTAQTVTDTGGTTNNQYISAATSSVTIGGSPASGGHVFFWVYRDAANGSDTLAIDARLLGVKILYTTNAPNDN